MVQNVGGLSAAAVYIHACCLYGKADVLLLIETKMLTVDSVKAKLAALFPDNQPEVAGVPCERNDELVGDGTQRRQHSFGGILLITFNPRVKSKLVNKYDGVVSFDCLVDGMRPFCIIGCYLPHPSSPLHHTVGARLENMKQEYRSARARGRRTVIGGDFNIHVGNAPGHFCVKPDQSRQDLRRQLLDAWDDIGVLPLHGRCSKSRAFPTSYAPGSTREGVILARMRHECPGSESDYVLGCASWNESFEFSLYRRDEPTVPYLGGPLHADPTFHPLVPPRHDVLAVQLHLVPDQREQVVPPPPRQPRLPKPAAYGDSMRWYAAAAAAAAPLDKMLMDVAALPADAGADTVMASFAGNVAAVTNAVGAAMEGHERHVLPWEKGGRRWRPPVLAKVHADLKASGRDRQQLVAQLLLDGRGNIMDCDHNNLVQERLLQVKALIQKHLKQHRLLMRRETRRIIMVQARREEALMRWDAHTAALNIHRNNDPAFAMRGRAHIPQEGNVPPVQRFHAHIAGRSCRPVGPPVPAIQLLLHVFAMHAVGAAAVPPPPPPGPPGPVAFNSVVAHLPVAGWRQHWAGEEARLKAEQAQIRERPVDLVNQLTLSGAFAGDILELHAAAARDAEAACAELARDSAARRAPHVAHRRCHACLELNGPLQQQYTALCECRATQQVADGAYTTTCVVCNADSNSKCGRCKAATYCSAACQREHWVRGGHRNACCPPPPVLQPPPSASGVHLDRNVTWRDVYMCTQPMHPDVRYCCITGGSPLPGTNSACPYCAKINDDVAAWNRDDPRQAVPEFPTQLHTGTAAGPAGVHAETLCWLRPRELKERLPFRQKLCDALARYFSQFIRLGLVPSSFKEALSTALLKSVKPGERADQADPDYYRFITVTNIMARLFGCVLVVRLSHWSDHSGITSDSQNAFRAGRNCEQHVISLIEILRARRRQKKSTWMVFIDFAKAYDMVDHEALWGVLLHTGVPPQLVKLLREWNTGRTSRLRLNGELSEPFEMNIGVPQGDVLSPWLFNLFIESLIRTIRADPVFAGVHEFGIRVKELLYADDLAMPCGDHGQAQRALDIVNAWCKAWGMRMNIGRRKTEVLVFGEKKPVVSPFDPHGWPPLMVDNQVVPYADEYRYLGMNVNTDLDYEPIIDRYADRLWTNYNRYFRTSSYIRHMTLRSQCIQFKTFVSSATTFLASALPAADLSKTKAMDERLLSALGNLLNLDRKSAVGTLLQEGKMPSTLYTWVRERTRVYLEALSTATHNPRILLHRILMRQTAPEYSHPETWLAQTEYMFRLQGYNGLQCPHCADGHGGGYVVPVAGGSDVSAREAKRAAVQCARLAATKRWAHSSRDGQWSKDMWASRPGTGQRAQRNWFLCGFPVDDLRLRIGGRHKCTRLSFTAPGGSGNIVCNADIPRSMADTLIQARQGSSAHLYRKQDGSFAHPTRCSACGMEAGDSYHFMFECTHAAVCKPAQERAHYVLRSIVPALVQRTRDIVKRLSDKLPTSGMLRAAGSVESALQHMNDAQWRSAEGVATLARLSFAAPWSRLDLPDAIVAGTTPAQMLAASLGHLFDSIIWPPHITMPLCTQWAFKACKAHRLCNAARDATHPEQPAHRRGGGDIHNARRDDQRQRADEAQAAAYAAEAREMAAAGIPAQVGDMPRRPTHHRRPSRPAWQRDISDFMRV